MGSIFSIFSILSSTCFSAFTNNLNNELFVKGIEVGRYEVIFDRAEGEMTPECKDELEAIKKTIE